MKYSQLLRLYTKPKFEVETTESTKIKERNQGGVSPYFLFIWLYNF